MVSTWPRVASTAGLTQAIPALLINEYCRSQYCGLTRLTCL